MQDATDPLGLVTRTLYDALGRVTKTIANYTGSAETADSDVATEYTYDGDSNVLTVKAERTSRTEEGLEWISGERFAGTFMRQISLGDGIDDEAISATYANGVLTVTIPVAEKAKSRRIEVTSAPEQTALEASPA